MSLLGLREATAAQIGAILRLATTYVQAFAQADKKLSCLRGRSILTLFYEPSTRTRVSFELAAKRLGADAVNIAASASAAQKGESLRDTARTLDAMRADLLVMRHPHSGAAALVAQQVRVPVINAGDGAHEHPTQGLLDLLTLQRHFGRLDGLRVAIVGDVLHSRVARSTLFGLLHMGAEVRLAGPRPLLPSPQQAGALAPARCLPLAEALHDADAVMTLRLQAERMAGGLLPSRREYADAFGINPERLRLAAPHAVVMHPGPVHRGVELADELVEAGCSLIAPQVEHGVAVRAAVMDLLLREGLP